MANLSLVQFKADIKKFAAQININQATVVRRISFDLWGKITKRTPVKTGRAHAGWGVSIGHAQVPTPPEGEYNPAPKPFPTVVIDGTQVVYILNNVEYIEALEDGHSKQAPAGMVRLAIAEVELEINSLTL